jgi:hypothetical protein
MPRKDVSIERRSIDSRDARRSSMEPISNDIQGNDSSLLLPINDGNDQVPGQAAFTFINDKIAEIGITLRENNTRIWQLPASFILALRIRMVSRLSRFSLI